MKILPLALAALLWMADAAPAQEMPEVPCDKLHFRIAGNEFVSTCRALERQGTDGRWRQESIFAQNATGVYVVLRAMPLSGRTAMKDVSPRRAADAAGIRDIQDWSREMRLEGYRAHGFTGTSPTGVLMRCLAFARNPTRTGGAQAQTIGVYCTAPDSPMDEAAAIQILQRIQAN